MTTLPLISCIIPVYNAEKYLGRCLESVLAQDYPNKEILLIDDGSSDASAQICDTYAKAHSKVSVWHIANSGASLARKKGLEYARGEYFTFVDSDDFIAKNYISILYNLIIKFGTTISACGVERVQENEQKLVTTTTDGEEQLLSIEQLMPRFFKYEFWGFPGALYHRSAFQNLRFPKATLSEDYYVKAQLFCNERKMAVTSAALYYYEYHPTSLSHTKLSSRAFEEYENVKAVYDYVQEHCPEYSDYALSNVVETAVKLCLMKTGNYYNKEFLDIFAFLKDKKDVLPHLSMLNRNVRIIAYGLALQSTICLRACKILTHILNSKK